MLVEADYLSKCAYLLETYKHQMMRHGERGNSEKGLWKRRDDYKQGNNFEVLRLGRSNHSYVAVDQSRH